MPLPVSSVCFHGATPTTTCKPGQNVLLLVHPEDELHGEEPYFVARVDTEAWKHPYGHFEGQLFDPGTWLTRVTWFARIRDDAARGFLYVQDPGWVSSRDTSQWAPPRQFPLPRVEDAVGSEERLVAEALSARQANGEGFVRVVVVVVGGG